MIKNTKKKVILSACLAVIFACIAVVSGVMLALSLNNSSKLNAASLADSTNEPQTPAKLVLSSEATGITPGGTITIKFTFSVPAGDGVLYALQTTVAPMNEDGTAVDYEVAQYLSVISSKTPRDFDRAEGDDDLSDIWSDYRPRVYDRFNYCNLDPSTNSDPGTNPKLNETGIFFMLAKSDSVIGTDVDYVFEVTLKLAENAPIDRIESLTFGMSVDYPLSFATTIPDAAHASQSSQVHYKATDANRYASNLLTFGVRDANSEAEIDSIKFVLDVKNEDGEPDTEEFVIYSEDGEDVTYFFNDYYCEITLPDTIDLSLLVFYPKMKDGSEGATVKAGATSNQANAPTLTELSASGTEIAVSGTNRYLYIQATPEDGDTEHANVYTVKLTFSYVRLSNLTATSSGFEDTSITKCDLDLEPTNGEFDRDTFEYTAFVPEGTVSTVVTPTLATDYGASTTITLVKDGGFVLTTGTTTTSSGSVVLLNISNDDKLSLKVTAQDGTVQTYEITFEVVTTDTSIKDLIVTGKPSDKVIPNNEDRVTELVEEGEDVDYFFSVAEDEFTLEITPNDESATIEIKRPGSDEFEPYNPETVYDELGDYVIKVTASAGNSEEYVMVVEKYDGFELKEDSDFALIALVQVEGQSGLYRRTYEEIGWTHGIDDVNVERYVLGEIVAGTQLSDVVNNILETKKEKVTIYDAEGYKVYDGANDEYFYGADSDAVCTSWKIVYGSGASAEEIYISVLADVNCDGKVNVLDIADLSTFLGRSGAITFSDLEVRLAAYVTNNGTISVLDAADLASIVSQNVSIDDFLRINAIDE